MFNPYSRAKIQVGQGQALPSTPQPLQQTNCLNRPELRAVRERHNSGSLAPSNTSPPSNDQSDRRFQPPPTSEQLIPASTWKAAERGRENELDRADNVFATGETEEILADLRGKENILERKLAEVENARRTAEDRYQRDIAARSNIEKRVIKLEKKASDIDDALKGTEKRFQREASARNVIEKNVSRLEKKLVSVQETLIGSEKRHQRESNGRNMVERRLVELEKKLSEVTHAYKDAEYVCEREKDTRKAIADSIADLQGRVTAMDSNIKRVEKHHQGIIDSGFVTDEQAARLDHEVKNLQGQLLVEKAAVDVERGNVQQLKAELANSNYQLDKETALLKSERMKTKILADREAERLNTSSEERVRIAQEKLKVLSRALSEEREKSKKLKEALTGAQSELNSFKRKAGNNDIVLEPHPELETQEKRSEHGRIQTPSDQSVADQANEGQAIGSHGHSNAETKPMSKDDRQGHPSPNGRKLSQHSICLSPLGSEDSLASEQRPVSRFVDSTQGGLARGPQSPTVLQNCTPRKPTTEELAKPVPNSRTDQPSSGNADPSAAFQSATNEGSPTRLQPLVAKEIISEEEQCSEQKPEPVVPTEMPMSNSRPAVEGQSSFSINSQLVPTAPRQHTSSRLSDPQKNVALSRRAAPGTRYVPPQKCRTLQKFSETQSHPISRNSGNPIQRYVPSQLFVPGAHRARPWDLDHPDNFAPRQHFSFTETPFAMQFAPAQIAPTTEGYGGPQLLAQPYPVDNPQKSLSRRPPVTTANRSLYTADAAGLSQTQR